MHAAQANFVSELFRRATSRKSCRSSTPTAATRRCSTTAVELLVMAGARTAARDDDDDSRAVGKSREHVAGEARVLRISFLPDGAVGRPGVHRVHRRHPHRRVPRPQRPAPVALLCHEGRHGHHGVGSRRAAGGAGAHCCKKAGCSRAGCFWWTPNRAASSRTRS